MTIDSNFVPNFFHNDELKCVAIAWYPCYHGIMIRSFKQKGAEDIFNGKNSKTARKTCPRSLWKIAGRKLDQLDSASKLDELGVPPGNRLEALKGVRKGQHSIRINDQYRICFHWVDFEPDEVEITDYH
jgi:proteic killer suppression protein